jgi:uncharacterized protein YlxP (DUF503 family)
MIIAACTLFLRIPHSHSLKDKRQVLRSIIARVRRDFNVSVAEVDQQDSWQQAALGLACVSPDAGYAHGLLTKAVEAISRYRIDAEILDYEIEIL